MSETVDRVARALWDDRQPGEEWSDLEKLNYEGHARAAIEAMPPLADWIAYADKLEAALKLATGQRNDTLMRMHAEQGLRLVRPTLS